MLGIIVAVDEELTEVLKIFDSVKEEVYNGKTFYISNNIVVVQCGVGKVNAALTTQMLIDKYNVKKIINIGVAGSVDNSLNVGDIVVADKLVQYDFDLTAFGRKLGEMKNIGEYISVDPSLINVFKDKNVKIGCISSGDKFVNDINLKNFIREYFGALCVEMEGASIAQVCFVNKIPFIVIRSISDKLDGTSTIEYDEFVSESSKTVVSLLKSVIDTL